ncbi:M1 family metallopeptidase [Pimelobacter sp. 30-1]|uniref:M1 family metallopeptidase n=1 Tax=Pimelobacter sp. 30-1 TaxID=2004991 RepID=UPI001C03C9A6|nr:M1 family metallopeptidase [Pimelobacter sp. 30-1]
MPVTPRRALATLVTLALGLTLAACGEDAAGTRADPMSSGSGAGVPGPTGEPTRVTDRGDLSVARSETREDSVYPEVGDPLVDALHYALDLTWDPKQDRLSAKQKLTFRATTDAAQIPLALSDALEVSALTVDGEKAAFTGADDRLTIDHPVTADQQYVVELAYAGTPVPADAPSTRSDFRQGLGWNITDDHETWTMQEPYGAFTWYAVNDQPADKALYDFTLTVPEPWSGVANGVLTDTTTRKGMVTDVWHLAEPASSYLVTVAFGHYQRTDLKSASGVPVQVWAPADGEALPGGTGTAPDAIDWLEKILGPYPFESFGIVVVDNESGMETQTMVTLGNTEYSLSPAVVVHEAAHHWYGDTVSPADWSDVWMNEGMAMYLQGMWEAEQEGISIDRKMDEWAGFEDDLRAGAGPPGDYDPQQFGDGNIYYGPAVMWQELRKKIGDDRFFALLKDWPASRENRSTDRADYLAWIEKETGEDLGAFFDAWLLDKQSPPRA